MILYTLLEAANILRIKVPTLRVYIKRRYIESHKISYKVTRISSIQIEDFLNRNQTGTTVNKD